jgi:hypothetical protein
LSNVLSYNEGDKLIDVKLDINNYFNNNCLYIGLLRNNGEWFEPFIDLTVNIGEETKDYCAFINMNKYPELKNFLIYNRLGEFTGEVKEINGYKYHLFRFDENKLRNICPEGVDLYERNIEIVTGKRRAR